MQSVPLEPQGKQSRGMGIAATESLIRLGSIFLVVSNYEYGDDAYRALLQSWGPPSGTSAWLTLWPTGLTPQYALSSG